MEVKLVIVSFTFSQQEKYVFLLPLPHPSVVYYTCTSTPAHGTPSPAFSCYQVPVCQRLAENISLSKTPELAGLASEQIPSMDGGHSWALFLHTHPYAPSPSHFGALNVHHEYSWVIEGILRMGNEIYVQMQWKHPLVHCRGSFISSVRFCLQAF